MHVASVRTETAKPAGHNAQLTRCQHRLCDGNLELAADKVKLHLLLFEFQPRRQLAMTTAGYEGWLRPRTLCTTSCLLRSQGAAQAAEIPGCRRANV